MIDVSDVSDVGDLHDVVVVGVGAMGSSAAWALSKAGHDVVAVEQFPFGHDRGSSHGASRIYRVGTEQTHYLDLAQRARVLWGELEAATGEQLLTVQGAVEHGVTQEQVDAFVEHLRVRDIEHEVLDPGDAADRWPGMRFDGPVLHQPDGAGRIDGDQAVAALTAAARGHGAQVRRPLAATAVDVRHDDLVHVHTPSGVCTWTRSSWRTSTAVAASGLRTCAP